MDFDIFFSDYNIKCFVRDDVPDLYQFCKENITYYQYLHLEPTPESLIHELTKLPPKKSLDDKYFVGFYQKGVLVAILDLIKGYPNEKTAFVGWFMVKKSLQNMGIGKKIFEQLLELLKAEGFEQVRLGCVKENKEGEYFWRRNGFKPTGAKYETDGYTVILKERKI